MGELQQVTNLFDVTTDCKVTELFCIIDEFCKHFDAESKSEFTLQINIHRYPISYERFEFLQQIRLQRFYNTSAAKQLSISQKKPKEVPRHEGTEHFNAILI